MKLNSLRPLDVIWTHLRRAYPYSGLSPHRDENLEIGTKTSFTCWKLVKTPLFELLLVNSLLYVQFVVNIECAALLEHSILLLTVVISCVLLDHFWELSPHLIGTLGLHCSGPLLSVSFGAMLLKK